MEKPGPWKQSVSPDHWSVTSLRKGQFLAGQRPLQMSRGPPADDQKIMRLSLARVDLQKAE